MTIELETELTQDGGALYEAEKSIEEGKNNLQDSVDNITESVSRKSQNLSMKLRVRIILFSGIHLQERSSVTMLTNYQSTITTGILFA